MLKKIKYVWYKVGIIYGEIKLNVPNFPLEMVKWTIFIKHKKYM